MCELLGSTPIESEIPVEYGDLSLDVQAALSIYSKLRDEWDTVNGTYLGKSYAGIVDIFDILDVPTEDRRSTFELIEMIDTQRAKVMKANAPKPNKKPS